MQQVGTLAAVRPAQRGVCGGKSAPWTQAGSLKGISGSGGAGFVHLASAAGSCCHALQLKLLPAHMNLPPSSLQRIAMCKSKGFVAVDPDNVDGYTNPNGVGLTAADQLSYNTFLANEAHAQGMAIGLKNDLDQLTQLTPYFDFFVNE
jgi:hypothetical protein